MGVAHGADARVADGGATDVGTEVLDGRGCRRRRAGGARPSPCPRRRGSTGGSAWVGAQGGETGAEGLAEALAQDGNGDEDVRALDGDDVPLGIDARSGDDAVEVGMEAEALVPGMQHEGEAAFDRAEPAGTGKGAGEGLGGRRKEEVVNGFGGGGCGRARATPAGA